MKQNVVVLEERLSQIVKILESMETFIDQLDFSLPKPAKELILKAVQSKEIKEIVDGVKEKRPPKLVIMGRSGVGKSSLINAMFGEYLAETSSVNVGTTEAHVFQYKKGDEVVFEIIDTRGIRENVQETDSEAEIDLQKVIEDFEPDAFLLITNGADRSTLREDAMYLNEIYKKLDIHVPLITVINRIDDIEPSRIKEPTQYSTKKKENINTKVEQVKEVLSDVGISKAFVVPVSSYIEWNHDNPEELTKEEKEALTIEFDGRYNIDKLLQLLEDNIDFRAAVYMMLNNKYEVAIRKVADKFIKVFSTASASIAITPIPASDIAILIPIQILEVRVIAYLAGEKLDVKSAREFILSLGGVALFGMALRFIAQQGSKLLNLTIPGSGAAISSSLAYTGTYSVGKAALAYYIDGKSKEESKKLMEEAQEETKNKQTILS
ncbi:hypothetical protein ASO14_2931 [Kurthia sp. 11kri321]|nr:hypothetical protein ASO14_2931 [Kurthia sp. 11kri321]